jgi:hypothetical protein
MMEVQMAFCCTGPPVPAPSFNVSTLRGSKTEGKYFITPRSEPPNEPDLDPSQPSPDSWQHLQQQDYNRGEDQANAADCVVVAYPDEYAKHKKQNSDDDCGHGITPSGSGCSSSRTDGWRE